MRVLAVVLSCLLIATAVADARPQRRPVKQQRHKQVKPAAVRQPAARQPAAKQPAAKRPVVAKQRAAAEQRVAAEQRTAFADPQPIDPYASPAPDDLREDAPAPRRRARGQSIGAPWAGRLQDASRLRVGDRAHIRRPHRAYGTKTTVEHVRRAVRATLASHPKAHVLAIGDLSAQHGGRITEHSSHRSGRDVDLGLFYKRRPAGYPAGFVRVTNDNLDRAATWALLVNLLASHDEDGGVQVIFLDHDVQGLLYKWAQASGVKPGLLGRIFQYPHGRGAGAGLVRHESNHADHLHVRFRCAKADADCY